MAKKRAVSVTLKLNKDGTMSMRSTGGYDLRKLSGLAGKVLADAPVAFGLEAQGHIQTIETMLADGADWQEIGRSINWDGETAKSYYERHLARKVGA